LDDLAVVYLDDIMIYSKSREDHLHHLKLVFDKLKANQLYVKLKKCEFMQQEVEYLRFCHSLRKFYRNYFSRRRS
jgi:hypothetical protein